LLARDRGCPPKSFARLSKNLLSKWGGKSFVQLGCLGQTLGRGQQKIYLTKDFRLPALLSLDKRFIAQKNKGGAQAPAF